MLLEAKKLFPFLGEIGGEVLLKQVKAVTTRLPKGTPAFIEGEPIRHVAFVLNGTVRVYKSYPHGRELTLYYVTAGDSCVLMWASVLANASYGAQATAATDTDVLLVPVSAFHDWMGRYEAVRRFVYESFAHRLATVMMLVDEILFRQVDQRLADLLLKRTHEKDPVIHITHEQLALELGTTREVISRILKSFEEDGAVKLFRGRIELIDRPMLVHKRDGVLA